MKAAKVVMEVLLVGLIISGFSAADAWFDGFITFNVFVARTGLFGALAGVLIQKIKRCEHEEDRD